MTNASAKTAPSPNPSVKITSVEPFLMRGARGYQAWCMVRVQTDLGIEGIGEGFSWGYGNLTFPRRVHEYMQVLGGRLAGKSPWQIQAFVHDAQANPAEHAREWHSAVSGIEIALWDIAGKLANLPVYQMLGGKVREAIPLYANHGIFFDADASYNFNIDRIVHARQAGYRMFKWDPGMDFDQVREARQVIGRDYRLAIDQHGRNDFDGAVAAAKALQPLDVVFLDDPVPCARLDLYRQLVEITSIPLATGENFTTRREVHDFLASGAIRFLQPEIGANGGIMETVKVAAMAETSGVGLYPHNWCGPVVTRALAHAACVVPNLVMMEYAACSPAPDVQWEHELIDPPNRVIDGFMAVPEGPGLGFTLNEALVAGRLLEDGS